VAADKAVLKKRKTLLSLYDGTIFGPSSRRKLFVAFTEPVVADCLILPFTNIDIKWKFSTNFLN
jgi:hypothetical protein